MSIQINEGYSDKKQLSIVGIVGSPRKGMNTDIIIDSVLDGCRSKGAVISKIYLNDLDIKPCQACRIQDGKGCRFHDGMDTIKQAFENNDGIVLGIPIYYGLMSSQVKLMIDRSYCFAERVEFPSGKVEFLTHIQNPKKGLVVSVSNSHQNSNGISDCMESWSNEVNLVIFKEAFVNHKEIGSEARNNLNVLEDMFRYGEFLYEEILKA